MSEGYLARIAAVSGVSGAAFWKSVGNNGWLWGTEPGRKWGREGKRMCG